MTDPKLTIDDVRHEYVTSFRAEHQQEARQVFDAWLREHNARVWNEGYDAGERDALERGTYREGQK